MKHATGMETYTKIFFWCIFNLVAILTVQFDDVTVKTIYNFFMACTRQLEILAIVLPLFNVCFLKKVGFLLFYLYFFKAEQCSEGHFRWEQVAMALTGDPRLGAHSSVLSSVYVCMYQCIYPALFTQSPPVPPN